MGKAYLKKDLDKIPLDNDGCAETDLFVYLPLAKKYIRYVREGDEVEEEKLENVKSHKVPHLYVIEGAAGRSEIKESDLENANDSDKGEAEEKVFKSVSALKEEGEEFSNQPELSEEEKENLEILNEEFDNDLIAESSHHKIEKLWKDIKEIKDEDNPEQTLKTLETTSDDLVESLVGDAKNLKKRLLRNLKFIHLMNDVSAITALACLVGFANGYDSKKSYREMIIACLLMDASLGEIDRQEWENFIIDPSKVSEDILNQIHQHPVESHNMISNNLQAIPDASLQLILNHHELHNGDGYPRGVRNGNLAPICRLMALSVDLFEQMKSATFQNLPSSIPYLLRQMAAPGVEPHRRRHNLEFVNKTIRFIESP